MEVKVIETWISTILFEYSKRYHLKGSQVPCALKPISRISSETNDGILSLSARITSIFSSGITAANNDPIPDPSYITARIEALTTLCSEFGVPDSERLIPFIIVPRALGGLGCLPFSAFCYRGHLDPLTGAISLMRTLRALDKDLYNYTSKMVSLDPANNRLEMLVIDPFCLNVTLPDS